MTGREYLQLIVLSLTLASILLVGVCWRKRVMGRGYLVAILMYLVHLTLFYFTVFIRHAPPSELITIWSSAIRLQLAVTIIIGLYIVASKDSAV